MTDTSSLSHLIERLEKATGPDRELDASINLEVFSQIALPDAPQYTSSIDAAMTLVPEGMEKDFTDLYGVARVSVGINANPGPFYGTHEGGSLAIALCIAALKAQLSTRTNEQDDARNLSGVSSE